MALVNIISVIRTRAFLLNALVLIGLLWLTALYSPPQFGLSKYAIPSTDIEFREADHGISVSAFDLQEAEGNLRTQFRNRETKIRYFNFEFPEEFVTRDRNTVFIPDSGGQVRLGFIGGYGGLSLPHGFFAPGFGTQSKSYAIPRHYLVPGTNRLKIWLVSDETRAGIRRVYLAPESVVIRAQERQSSWMTTTPALAQIGFGICVFMSVFALLIGQNKSFLAIQSFVCLYFLFQSIVPELIGLNWLSALLLRQVLPVLSLCLVLCLWGCKRMTKAQTPNLFYGLMIFALLGPVLSLLIQHSSIYSLEPHFVATIFYLSALPVLIFLSAISLRTGLSLRRSRLQKLTETVALQSEELDEKTRLIVEEMRQRALMEERQRFTRDIHDGIGGKLLSLLLGVRTGELERDEIAEEVQSSIRDLRLVVDSIDQMGEDLTAVLETFKARALQQFRIADIQLNWRQPELILGQLKQNRGHTLHLYRLLQEGLTNIVKHAKASNVDISIAQPDEDVLIIDIIDDGIGIADNREEQNGNGLTNMKSRAKSIGAKLDLNARNDRSGTHLHLEIPLDL